MLKRVTAVLCVVLWSMVASAQPLSDRVPSGAMVYVGWQGTETMAGAYEKSHLKAILDGCSVADVLREALPELLRRTGQTDPQAKTALDAAGILGQALWRHPSAFYFAGVDLQNPKLPVPKLALLCKADKDADALLQLFTGIAGAAKAPFPVKAIRQGDVVALTVGYAEEGQALAGGPGGGKALAGDEKFQATVKQGLKEPVAVVYGDVEAMIAMIDKAVEAGRDFTARTMWPKVRDGLGVGSVKRFIWTGGFVGPDWASECFVAAPNPRGGLAKLMDGGALSPEVLKAIPATATLAGAGRFDLGKLFAEIRTASGVIEPTSLVYFDQAIGFGQAAMGVNVQKDFLEALGDEWSMYLDPEAMGTGPLGVVGINRLARPADAERSIGKIALFLDNVINGQLERQKLRISFEQTSFSGVKLNYLALPAIAPSWTIKDGVLYMGLYPQALAPAVQRTSSQSILDNPAFKSLRQRMGCENASGFAFMDLPKMAGESYQTMLLIAQLINGGADMMGVKTKAMAIPPLPALRQHLSAAATFSWTDEAGWHSRSLSPFPGSTLMFSPTTFATAGVVPAVAIPAIIKAKGQ